MAGLVALVALAAGLLLLLGWSAWYHATPDVRSGVIGYTVVDDTRVDLHFEVVADPGAPVECDLRAQNLSQETVGSSSVVVPPSSGPGAAARREVRAVIKTRQRAVNGELQACRLLPR